MQAKQLPDFSLVGRTIVLKGACAVSDRVSIAIDVQPYRAWVDLISAFKLSMVMGSSSIILFTHTF